MASEGNAINKENFSYSSDRNYYYLHFKKFSHFSVEMEEINFGFSWKNGPIVDFKNTWD